MWSLVLLQDGSSPLWIAAQMGHAVVCKYLLEANAELEAAREVCVSPAKSPLGYDRSLDQKHHAVLFHYFREIFVLVLCK